MVKRIRLYLRRKRITILLGRLERSKQRLEIYTTLNASTCGYDLPFRSDIRAERKRIDAIWWKLIVLKQKYLNERYIKKIDTKI